MPHLVSKYLHFTNHKYWFNKQSPQYLYQYPALWTVLPVSLVPWYHCHPLLHKCHFCITYDFVVKSCSCCLQESQYRSGVWMSHSSLSFVKLYLYFPLSLTVWSHSACCVDEVARLTRAVILLPVYYCQVSSHKQNTYHILSLMFYVSHHLSPKLLLKCPMNVYVYCNKTRGGQDLSGSVIVIHDSHPW